MRNYIIFFRLAVEYSVKDMCEAQDTILYHLSTCTEFKINEKEMVNQFRVRFPHQIELVNWRFIDIFTSFAGIGIDAAIPLDTIFDQCIVNDVQYKSIFGLDATIVIGSVTIFAYRHT